MNICHKCHSELNLGERCPLGDGGYGVSRVDLLSGDGLIGQTLDERFVILRRIGQGGMGVVYEGRQLGFGRKVAIKVLSSFQQSNQQVMQRFQREAKSIARIIHPNVVQLIDNGYDVKQASAYIVMEYVDGRELSSLEGHELSGQVIVHIANQILSALIEAHAMHVIHRDLKPDNIMISKDGGDNFFVKVLDFGLAALNDGSKVTASGQALGTPWYMSPEQATASPVTATTDLYSLGCILYELASSKPPFPGNRPFNVMMQHVNAEVPPIVLRPEIELSGQMQNFIMRCLEKLPEDRYASANLARAELQTVPEWVAAIQSDASQSIRLVMRQLSEMADIRSDVLMATAGSSPSNVEIARLARSDSMPISVDAQQIKTDNILSTTGQGQKTLSRSLIQKKKERRLLILGIILLILVIVLLFKVLLYA